MKLCPNCQSTRYKKNLLTGGKVCHKCHYVNNPNSTSIVVSNYPEIDFNRDEISFGKPVKQEY